MIITEKKELDAFMRLLPEGTNFAGEGRYGKITVLCPNGDKIVLSVLSPPNILLHKIKRILAKML